MIKYYFSNTGNDSNNGISPGEAWQNLEKIQYLNLKAGDEILLNRGDVFSGSIALKASGAINKTIKIGAFGNGSKPILKGSIELNDFDKWKTGYTKKVDVDHIYDVFIERDWLNLARYPTTGFFGIDGGDKLKLVDKELTFENIDCTGATVRIRAVNWQYEIMKVEKHVADTLYFTNNMLYECTKDYGYFLDNKLEFLTDNGEWFFEESKKQLYFRGVNNEALGKKKVDAVIYKNGVYLKNAQHIEIADINFQRFSHAGIFAEHNCSNIRISNCEFSFIHQDGINLDQGTKNVLLENNIIFNIKGRGIICLDNEQVKINKNEIYNIGHYPGYGFDGVNSGTGIAILKTEVVYKVTNTTIQNVSDALPIETMLKLKQLKDLPYPDEKFLVSALEEIFTKEEVFDFKDQIIQQVTSELEGFVYDSVLNYVGYNNIHDTGLHCIRIDGKNHICEYNITKTSLLYMNDGSSIYSWAQNYNYSVGTIIRNNIVIKAKGNVVATPDFHRFAHGIYLDNKCVGFLVENNIVTETTWGILINDEARENIVKNNVLFDNDCGLVFSEYFMPGTLYGCHAYNNILFSRKRSQRSLLIESRISPEFKPVILDGNFYGSSYYTYPITRLIFKDNHRVFEEFDLESWQNEYGNDERSVYWAPNNPEARPRLSSIIINESLERMTFYIDNSVRDHYDIYNNKLNDEVVLAPFSALIVLTD